MATHARDFSAGDTPMTRAYKLDEEKKRRLLRRVIEGDSVEEAACVVGCCRRTVQRAARRDSLFGWRLKTARSTRDELRRRKRVEEELAAETYGGLFHGLHSGLTRAWDGGPRPRPGAEGGDIPLTPGAA